MKYGVVYFSRTGNSKRVAEKIAAKLSCETISITDNKNWHGPIGFLKGGYESRRNKEIKIYVSEDIDGYDQLIVVSPLWAGGIAPTTKTFLKTLPGEKVHLVLTSMGSRLENRGGYKSISDVIKQKNNEDIVIQDLVDRLLALEK